MRRSTLNEYDKLGQQLSTQVTLMKYRFMNLCIQSDPVALLPIQVFIEGEPKHLEDCATIGKSDNYHFEILPKYDEDMKSIMQSVLRAHPEFKQEIKNMHVESHDADGNPQSIDVQYLQLTMPEVNDDRYDALNQGVKAVYEECKAQMEAINATAKPKFAEMAQLESEDDKKRLNDNLDRQKKQWDEQRENLYKEKLKEIDDAHNKWLAEQMANNQERQEHKDAQGEEAAHSMRMNPKDAN
jgi:ribosome recycling factor